VLASELDRQVFADGMHFERSVGYHRYTAEFYLHYMLLARAAGEPIAPAAAERIRRLVAVSWLTRLPDGSWPIIGDEDSSSTLPLGTADMQSHSAILATGAALFGERSWLHGADAGGRAAAWWMLDGDRWDALGTMAPGAGPASGALPDAGYFVGREDASPASWFCLVDAGPHGGRRTHRGRARCGSRAPGPRLRVVYHEYRRPALVAVRGRSRLPGHRRRAARASARGVFLAAHPECAARAERRRRYAVVV
jgi:hypothetical protein